MNGAVITSGGHTEAIGDCHRARAARMRPAAGLARGQIVPFFARQSRSVCRASLTNAGGLRRHARRYCSHSPYKSWPSAVIECAIQGCRKCLPVYTAWADEAAVQVAPASGVLTRAPA
jgi:hypothetical protein